MANKFDILYQRLQVDIKAGKADDKRIYTVDFEIHNNQVIIGEIHEFVDRFDTRGQLLYQDERQQLYNTVQKVLEERFVK